VRKIGLVLALAIGFASCGDGDDTIAESAGNIYKVSFNPKGLEQSFSRDISDFNKYNYIVFDDSDTYVKMLQFNRGEAIEDEFYAGSFSVYLASSNRQHWKFNCNTKDKINESSFVGFDTNLLDAESFLGKVEITVDGKKDLETPITLDRITSRLIVNLTDTNKDMNTIDVEVLNVANAITLTEGYMAVDETYSINKRFNYGESINIDFLNNQGREVSGVDVTITTYDDTEKLLSRKTIDAVKVYRNGKTTLTGSTVNSSMFDIKYNTDWSSDNNIEI